MEIAIGQSLLAVSGYMVGGRKLADSGMEIKAEAEYSWIQENLKMVDYNGGHQ